MSQDSPLFREEGKQKQETREERWIKHHQLLADIRETFKTPHGMRVLDWLLGLCQTGVSIFTGNSQTFYNAGQQDIGQNIINMTLEADPELYAILLRRKARELQERAKNKP